MNIRTAIDNELLSGTGRHGGKQRVLAFFAKEHASAKRIAFLKNEYGVWGHSPWESDYWVRYSPSEGAVFRRGKEDDIKISWAKIAKYIAELIADGRYGEE